MAAVPRLARLLFLGLRLTAAALAGCASSKPLHDPGPAGRFHVLREGESLRALAEAQGVPLEDLLEINGLRRAEDARPGQTVFVLDGGAGGVAGANEPAEAPAGEPARAVEGPRAARGSPAPRAAPGAIGSPGRGPATPARPAASFFLRWPVREPRVSSTFGVRQGRAHDGVDLAAPLGTPVYAARDGVVLYAGDAV
jgi:murein DD-endopeptidase MepM/ murein hydrolase activator NlpD